VSDTGDSSPSSVDEILARYLEQLDRGEKVDREKIMQDNPAHAEELREYFEASAAFAPPVSSAPVDDVHDDETVSSPDVGSAVSMAADRGPSLGSRLRYFGDYEILEEIARGGMGIVYKARQASLDRLVALKVILQGDFASEAAVRRFRREAEAAAQLDHPNIVPIYEVGEHDACHYFTMKLIDGRNLSDARSALGSDQKEVGRLVVKIARAVDFAHRRGVVHRDLKPANILIDAKGEPHVTDFGLARRIGSEARLTVTNAIIGTPYYMAPEQAAGHPVLTTAVDVYALGVIVFELLAGRPPFRGASTMETLRQVIEEEAPKLSSVRRDVDRDLEAITQRCLEKAPERRYRTAGELADDLELFLAGKPIHARPISWTRHAVKWARRRWQPLAVSALVLTLAALAGGLAITERRASDGRQRANTISLLQQSIDQNKPLTFITAYGPTIRADLRRRLDSGDEVIAQMVRRLSVHIHSDIPAYGLISNPPLLHTAFASGQNLIPIFSYAAVEGSWDGGPWVPLHTATGATDNQSGGFMGGVDLAAAFGRARITEGPHRLALRANVVLYDARSFPRRPASSIKAGSADHSSWPELAYGRVIARELRDLGERRITLFGQYPDSFPQLVSDPEMEPLLRLEKIQLIIVDYRPGDAPCRDTAVTAHPLRLPTAGPTRSLRWSDPEQSNLQSLRSLDLPCAADTGIQNLVVGLHLGGSSSLSSIAIAGEASLTFAGAPGSPIGFGFGVGGGQVYGGGPKSFRQTGAFFGMDTTSSFEFVIDDLFVSSASDPLPRPAMASPLPEGTYDAEFRVIPSRELALATSRIDRLYDRPLVIPVRVEIVRGIVQPSP
jgi:serine/threonine protein kinase